MKVAYVDTSWLLAIAFGEAGGAAAARLLTTFDVLISSALLEAELLAALQREAVSLESAPDPGISWILPDRSLRREIERTLAAGYLRGADLWHIATALFASTASADLTFLTFDGRQREVAAALGFTTATV